MLPEPITKLIIAEDQAEDAEQIISVLRNSGIALRPQRISTEEELAASLESFTPDLVLANPGCKDITLAAIGRALDATVRRSRGGGRGGGPGWPTPPRRVAGGGGA